MKRKKIFKASTYEDGFYSKEAKFTRRLERLEILQSCADGLSLRNHFHTNYFHGVKNMRIIAPKNIM